jgi:glutamine synthetase
MAFGNRVEGSFVRLTQGKEAPTSMAWGEFDRHALVRLPIVAATPDGRQVSAPTIEFRLPDGSAHPHLLLAGVTQAMIAARAGDALDALLERTTSARVRQSPEGAPRLPKGRAEIATLLGDSRTMLEAGGVFPPSMLELLAEGLKQG